MTGAQEVPAAAMPLRSAAHYLGVSPRWLEAASHIPRCDVRRPGAKRPAWRWRRVDLDAFLASRVVEPGRASPWGEG